LSSKKGRIVTISVTTALTIAHVPTFHFLVAQATPCRRRVDNTTKAQLNVANGTREHRRGGKRAKASNPNINVVMRTARNDDDDDWGKFFIYI
jgi:hypothetical protein